MSDNLYIKGTDINTAQREVISFSESLKESTNTYIQAVKNILSNAIKDEQISNNINNLLIQAEGIPNAVDSISQNMKSNMARMQSDVNEVDNLRY